MSVSFDLESDWNFRVFDKRLIVVKTQNESVRKIAVLDVLTNLTFSVEVPDMISMKELNVDEEYLANATFLGGVLRYERPAATLL